MPAKKSINLVKAEYPRQRFSAPSKACARERGLYESMDGLVIGKNNQGVFNKTSWSACKQSPSAAGKRSR